MCLADENCSHAVIGRLVNAAQTTLQIVLTLIGILVALAISSNREGPAGIGHTAIAVVLQGTARMNIGILA